MTHIPDTFSFRASSPRAVPTLPSAFTRRAPRALVHVFPALLDIAMRAGQRILDYYGTDVSVALKEDESPVTPADEAANVLICRELANLLPAVPVVSEENAPPAAEERAGWRHYFLVDPLDGTKGFLNRNGQFTVNIAYMRNHQPVAGIIHVPVSGLTYFGTRGAGAFRFAHVPPALEAPGAGMLTTLLAASDREGAPGTHPRDGADEGEGTSIPVLHRIHVRERKDTPVVLQSNVERTPRLDAFMGTVPHARIRAGSSLKFCLLAEGAAQVFPCLHPTWEWDTAAGHAILLAAGGSLVRADGRAFQYGKPSLLNDWFVARA